MEMMNVTYVSGTGGDGGANSQRDQSGGEDSFECPVVGSVRPVGRRELGGIIHGSRQNG